MNTTINKLQKIISNLLVLVVLFLISPVQVYAAAKATGGTYTEVGGYGIHKFTSSGTFTTIESLSVEYLIVGGGGGGGSSTFYVSGGGGGGGMRAGATSASGGYSVVVGNGGGQTTNGSASSFAGVSATGGGRGGYQNNWPGASGGSGGGGAFNYAGGAGIGGQGYAGSIGKIAGNEWSMYAGGGGGGAGGAATAASTSCTGRAGAGGIGGLSSITGTSVRYAGGGGGGAWALFGGVCPSYGGGLAGAGGGGYGGKNGGGGSGTNGLGGGGGGAANNGAGGTGGKGVVIVRYSLIPTAPTIGSATILSSASIQWNFTDNASNETGFKVYDTSNVLKATCATTNLSSCAETSLSANTSYTRKVVSYNATGNSGYSNTASEYTFATTPAVPVVNNAAVTTLDVNPDPNSSPTSTEMVIYKETGDSCDGSSGSYLAANGSDNSSTPVWQTESTWATVTATGLSEQTQYSFCTKSRNGDNIETSWGSAASGTTIETTAPNISSIDSIAGDSTATYYDATDDSSTVIAFTSTDGAGGGVDNCKWDTSDVDYDSMNTSCGSNSSCTVTPSGDGVKTVYIRCQDIYSNKMSSSQPVTYTIDSTAPSISSITSVAGDTSATYYDSTNDSSTAIVFSSTDGSGSGVTSCKWDTTDTAYSSMSNSCASTSSCTTDLAGEETKTIYIRCTDTAGNPMSSSQSVSYTIDAAAPTTLSATGSSASWTNSKPTVTISTPADSLSGMNEIRYVWDSNDLGIDCSAGTTTTATANLTSTLTEGSHILYLCASDNAGNVVTWNGAYKWDNSNPLINITTHTLTTYHASNIPAKIEGTASDVVSSVSNVAVSIYNGVNYWSGSLFDSLSQVWLAATGTSSWEYLFSPTTDGDYTLQSRSTDAANNTTTSATTNFTYDASMPVITIAESSTPNLTGATITWTTDEVSSTQLEYGLTTSYGHTTTEIDTSPRVTSHSNSISQLESCTSYHYRVLSKDVVDNTLTGTDKTFTTTGCVGTSTVQTEIDSTITKASGGEVDLQESGDSVVKLTIPANFSTADADFQVKKLDKTSVILVTSTPTTAKQAIGDHVYQLDALSDLNTKVTSFDEAISITMTYTDTQISGYDESSLSIYRWNGSDWYALDSCVIDTTLKTVTCTTTAFSTFVLFGEESAVVSDNGSADSSNEDGSGNSNSSCDNFSPGSHPDLFQISITDSSAKLFFTPLPDSSSFHISYSRDPNIEEYAVRTTLGRSGVQNYTINYLQPNTTYYFRLRGMNDCSSGDWSNSIKVKTNSEGSIKDTIFYKNKTVKNSLITVDTTDTPEDIEVSSENQDPKKGDVNLLNTPENISIDNDKPNFFKKIINFLQDTFKTIFNR